MEKQLNDSSLPSSNEWNHYWGLSQTQRFTKISWSKKRIMRILQPYMKKGKNALDAGCGSGFFSKYFCDQGLKTCALDYSEEALQIAKEKTLGRATVIKEDLTSTDIGKKISSKFDVIFSDGLLEHFIRSDQDIIVQNLGNLLTDQGVIVTFVPNKWSPWELIRPIYMPGIKETPFVLSQLIELHEQNGLKVIAQGGLNTMPFAFSPDTLLGPMFGMLLYTIAKKR